MCNNLCYLVVVFQEIYFTILIVFFAGAVVIVRNQKILIYLHCQPSYYFYYCKQDDIENENEIIVLSRTSRTRLKQLLWKSTVIKLVFFNRYWISSPFKWKLPNTTFISSCSVQNELYFLLWFWSLRVCSACSFSSTYLF